MGEERTTRRMPDGARVAIVGAGPAGALAAIALLDAAKARRKQLQVTLYHGGNGAGASRGPLLLDPGALSRLASFGTSLQAETAEPLHGVRAVADGLEAIRELPLFAAHRTGDDADFAASLRATAAAMGAEILERSVSAIHPTAGNGWVIRGDGATARAEAVILACGAGSPLATSIPGHVPPPLWRCCAAELELDEEAQRRLGGWSMLLHGDHELPDLRLTVGENAHLVALGEAVEPADLGRALLRAVATGRLPAGIRPGGARRLFVPAGAARPALPALGQALGGPPDAWGLAETAHQAQVLAAAFFDGGPDAMLEVTRTEALRLERRARQRIAQRRRWHRLRQAKRSRPLQNALVETALPASEGPGHPLAALALFFALFVAWLAALWSKVAGEKRRREPPRSDRVFVVDDDEDQAAMVCEFLRRRGIACEPYRDGLEAAAAVARERPAAVVLDVALPWLDGPNVCRALRSIANVPVILATALPLSLARAEAAAAGGVAVLPKPLDLEGLALRLQPYVPPPPPTPRVAAAGRAVAPGLPPQRDSHAGAASDRPS